MDYHGLVKRLQVPDGYIAPRELSYHDIRAHAISRADLDEDVRGINASLDIIRRTRDVDVSWRVTPAAYQHGFYHELYQALQHWISSAFPFQAAHYSNTEIPPHANI